MMTVVAVIIAVLLVAAGALTMTRIIRGPSVLDRIVATDVLLAVIVAAIAAQVAWSRGPPLCRCWWCCRSSASSGR
jgi:multicomponent Na+:H+ antiporter subunit F